MNVKLLVCLALLAGQVHGRANVTVHPSLAQFDLQECLAPQLAGTLRHVCPITANGAAAGHLSCVPYNSNLHGLNTPICQLTLIGSGRTVQREMSVRQFTLGAWYGDVEVQADEPCCVRFRRPFAIRVAGP